MESLAAHEFTQPLLPCPLVPAAGSGVGIQLGDAQVERLRKCRSWARGSPFRRETKKTGTHRVLLTRKWTAKSWRWDYLSNVSCWSAYFLLAISPTRIKALLEEALSSLFTAWNVVDFINIYWVMNLVLDTAWESCMTLKIFTLKSYFVLTLS